MYFFFSIILYINVFKNLQQNETYTYFKEKMGFCPFFLKYPAKCSMFETN